MARGDHEKVKWKFTKTGEDWFCFAGFVAAHVARGS
jgi:hypothetical protein